jgi:hypothetical protein
MVYIGQKEKTQRRRRKRKRKPYSIGVIEN